MREEGRMENGVVHWGIRPGGISRREDDDHQEQDG